MPPLRNAPSGTSAIMRMRTASSNFSRTLAHGVGVRESGRGARQRARAPASSVPARTPPVLVRQPASRPAAGAPRDTRVIGIGNVAELEVKPQRFGIGLERHAGLAQAGEFAAEVNARGQHGVVERLLAEAVARQQQAVPPRVPDGEGEHAAQALAVPRRLPLRRGGPGSRCRWRCGKRWPRAIRSARSSW